MIEDGLPFWLFSFFHASDSSENVPVHHSRACGASEGGIRGGEIMRAHTSCKEFTDSCSVGALPLPHPNIPTTLTTGTRPLVTTASQSTAIEGCDRASAAFWVLGAEQQRAKKLQRARLSAERGPNHIVSVHQFVSQHTATLTATQNRRGQLFPQ